ncbi:flagellar hook protein FlgE [Thermovibrio ammonificans]|uniref:Flagellar hook protein FlgE n=1 Tax=Thermovibrio ammonificans (strain DSM 15698 / JCM 12110 / HB-1) TaxID=648996 RepID=E8T479_THEA1|nr:flagellar hook protein FlgE [Thermovibrio ammonificans]ADU97408.1 flagellar hook-basal body protein [Thermovibrio ammonificans HB-1]
MLQSFYTAFTGLTADKRWLSIISDNIANVNTVGFKAERAVFEDLLARSLTTFKNGAPVNTEIGGGVFVSATVKDFSQGTFMNTNNPLDLALDGEGFFMVRDNQGLTYYTRNGEFRLDANGDLINMLGMKVQGWMLDDNGNMAGAISNITVPMSMDPKVTKNISFEEPSNLDSRADVITAQFDPANSTTYNYVNSQTVYDSLGNPHTLTYYFQKIDTGTWRVYTLIDGTLTPVTDGNGNYYEYVTLKFDSNGNVVSAGSDTQVSLAQNEQDTGTNGAFTLANPPVIGSVHIKAIDGVTVNIHDEGDGDGDGIGNLVDENGNVVGTINYATGEIQLEGDYANSSSITVDYLYNPTAATATLDYKDITITGYDPNTGAQTPFTFAVNYEKLRQLASDFIFYAQQDGNSKGDLMAVAVSEDGVIKATYSNGKVKDIARLAIATFKDKEMLVRKGSWLYVPNVQTFTPVIMPGGVISKVRSGMLEMSNVDIANEFINLITAQRSYQANARVITTDDQILQETMNIKR